MNRSTVTNLTRLKTHLARESRSMVMRGRPKRAEMFASWGVAVAEAIAANKELLILKNEKGVWK